MNATPLVRKKKCTFDRCRHSELRDGFIVEIGFECPHGHSCPILHPRLWWKQKWVWKASLLLAVFLAWGAISMIMAAVKRGWQPSIQDVSYSESVVSGSDWEAFVKAAGRAPITYQWYRGYSGDTSDPITDATGWRYSLHEVKAAFNVWVRVRNSYGIADSSTLSPALKFTVETIDYNRELSEASKLARDILEHTDSIRVFTEQLNSSYVPIKGEATTDWGRALRAKMAQRQETARNLIAKIDYLAKLDVILITRSIQDVKPWGQGAERERQEKTISYLRALWKKRIDLGALNEANVIGESDKVNF